MSRLMKQADKDLLVMLAEDIKGEEDAISLYEKHIAVVENTEVKNRLIEIRDDEKEHLRELTELVEKYK